MHRPLFYNKQLSIKHIFIGILCLTALTFALSIIFSRPSFAANQIASGLVVSQANVEKCLDNYEERARHNNKVQIYTCNGGENQTWTIYSDGSLRTQGLCLGVKNNSKKQKAPVRLYSCNNGPGQKWQTKLNGQIFNPHSGLCLDTKQSYMADETPVWTFSCSDTVTQKWQAPAITETSAPSPDPSPTPEPNPSTWQPTVGQTWQYQLMGPVDLSVQAKVYNIDGFETPALTIEAIHAQDSYAICYISAGSWEDWRPDANQFPAAIKGKNLDGWPGEKWLDTRNITALAPLMSSRMDMCAEKGFDGVEFDNVDGHIQDSGFAISDAQQLAYNKWLAQTAKAKGLNVGLKNDLDQVSRLVTDFDFAVNEECFAWNECSDLLPFIQAGKPVFHVEYGPSPSKFCPTTTALGFSSIKKSLDLKAPLTRCD